MEYKYVVVNADGRVGLWKPGSNYKVTMPLAGANGASKVLRRIKVADAWDDSFKKVDVEEAEGAPAQQPATSARASASAPAKPAQQQPTRPPAPPAAPVPPVAPSYRASSAPAATSYAANGAPKGAPVPPAPPPVPPTPPTPPQPPAKAVPPPQPVYMQLTEQELLSDGVSGRRSKREAGLCYLLVPPAPGQAAAPRNTTHGRQACKCVSRVVGAGPGQLPDGLGLVARCCCLPRGLAGTQLSGGAPRADGEAPAAAGADPRCGLQQAVEAGGAMLWGVLGGGLVAVCVCVVSILLAMALGLAGASG